MTKPRLSDLLAKMKSNQGRRVQVMDLRTLALEYLGIQKKKSRLPRAERDLVEARVEYLIQNGELIRKGDKITEKS